MALSTGDKLGPYEILSPIGAGGMGEVYKARDTRLDRTVAVKVLPEHIAKREDLRARFEREARAVASLNHPNICTLYDIGAQDGVGSYMVMECLEGETLAARIAKGAIPLDGALKFAVQIADALDRAHRAGVTHRDVKPQNIMLTRDGPKVLDFGLAKASAAKPGPSEATLTAVLTTEGTVMGTPQYMAPEQFEGKEADARSDIWAFGAVLYEMVTGQKAFQGKSYSTLVGAILATDPAPMSVKPFTPSWLERLVKRCLQKDPEDRWQSMRDVVIELQTPPQEVGQGHALPAQRMALRHWGAAGALAVALIVAGVLLYNATRPAPLRPLVRLNLDVDDTTPLALTGGGGLLALSPDGSRLAVTLLGADGKVHLCTRLLNQSQVTPLAGTERATAPFFSPDGQWIGFFTDGKLKKIAVEGGAALTLCDAGDRPSGTWGDDGNIIMASQQSVLSRVSSAGGTPVPVTKLNSGEITHRWPQVLPGSQAILFTANTHRGGYDDANIDVVSLKTGERKTVARGGFSPRYVPTSLETGHLMYMHQSTLFAVPFDPSRLATMGSPVPILEDVNSSLAAGGFFAFAAPPSGAGTFAYLPGKAASQGWSISWVDGSGKTQPLHAPLGLYRAPRLSPDGKRLAFSKGTGQGDDIWVKDLDRDAPSRLSFLAGTNLWPVWTPDGKNIVFSSNNPAAPGLYWIRSDGSGEAQRLTEGKPPEVPYSFSPDGKRLAFHRIGNGGQDLFTALIEGDAGHPKLGTPELFLGTPFSEVYPAFSPDGRWLAYSSNESGTFEVYVRPFPGPGGRWPISTGGGIFPLWSRDGRELLFETPDQRVMAVGYTAKGDSFTAGKPRLWTEARLLNTSTFSNYDPAPDGKRLAVFVADDATGDKPPTRLTFLLNFFDELRRRAPAK
jgi:serine/threonine-protein kinase